MNLNKIIDYCFAVLFRIIPTDENTWITGQVSSWDYNNTPPAFFDNSKYFFLYLVNHTNEKVYWVSSSKREIELLTELDLPVVNYHTFFGRWIVARARYSFHHYGDNTINKIAQLGKIQIDFWHGTPLKKIVYDVTPKEKHIYDRIVSFFDRKGEHYTASTSEYLSNSILSHAFDMPRDCFLNFGYPRTDILGKTKEETIAFCQKYSKDLIKYIEMIKNQRVLLYMPTFRDDDYEYFSKAEIDYVALNDRLVENNALFFVKLHPLTKGVDGIDGYSNIIVINNDVDIYPFLVFTDYLITDYSSIFFDFLHLDREIIFIPYDLDQYTSKRELYFDYKEFVPGIQYSTFKDFIDGISKLESIDFSEVRHAFTKRFIQDYGFDACSRTYNFFRIGGRNNDEDCNSCCWK